MVNLYSPVISIRSNNQFADDNSSESSELTKFLEQEKLKPRLPLGHRSKNQKRNTKRLSKGVIGGFSESKGNLNLLKSEV